MALDFPSTPTNGQIYTDATTGNRYVYISAYNYWSYQAANIVGGAANSQVIFSDSGASNGTAGFTFNKTTNVVTVSNSLTATISVNVASNVYMNTTAHVVVGNSTTAPTAILTGSALNIGNSTITGAPQITIANSAGTTTINAGAVTVTTGLYINSSTADLFMNSSAGLWANGTFGGNGQALSSNGTVVYWANITGASTNTQVLFNDSGYANGSATMTFNKTTGILVIN